MPRRLLQPCAPPVPGEGWEGPRPTAPAGAPHHPFLPLLPHGSIHSREKRGPGWKRGRITLCHTQEGAVSCPTPFPTGTGAGFGVFPPEDPLQLSPIHQCFLPPFSAKPPSLPPQY